MNEVFVACPVCFTGNHLQLDRLEQKLACEDCGFVLAENLSLNASEAEECIFCGNRDFYFESPLGLSFLGRDSICYVCEARYKTAWVNDPDEKYDQRLSERSQRSESAMRWKERIEQYHQQAG
jgi:transposase